jgi:hypothetical protein
VDAFLWGGQPGGGSGPEAWHAEVVLPLQGLGSSVPPPSSRPWAHWGP